jgi:phosphatidylserine/phosphatidylglycerophosphate/cardiolipin synthase-like enzyme
MLVAAVTISAVVLGSPLGARVGLATHITAGVTFNNPISSDTYDQNSILRKMMHAIDGTRSGATIRMAFFSLTVDKFVDKLIAAHNRGVNVRLIQDDHEIGPQWKRIVSHIGSSTSRRSWALVCHRSCMSDEDPSYMHAKLYMFSSSYGVPLVTMVSSANPTWTQARVGWNDLYTIVRDTTIYNSAKLYFEKLTAGALQDRCCNQSTGVPINTYYTATSSKYKIYYFPKGGEGWDDDPMYGILQNIKCTGAAIGYGKERRTLIKISMYQWSELRVRLAEKLWELDNAGCWVDIMYDPTRTDAAIIKALKKTGARYNGPGLTPTHEDRNSDGVPEHFAHNKYMLINGVYAGDISAKVVFTGSANWTNTALRYGNEIMLKVVDNAIYTAYVNHYDRVRAWAKTLPPGPPPITPTPVPTPTPRPTVRPSPTPTVRPSPSPTVRPPTAPPTAAPTATAVPPTASPVPTSVSPPSPGISTLPGAPMGDTYWERPMYNLPSLPMEAMITEWE